MDENRGNFFRGVFIALLLEVLVVILIVGLFF